MTKPSLSGIFRHASASRDSGVAADDVARVAAGERLGARHDAVVEALAGSPAGLLAYRALRDSQAQIQALVAGEQVVTAMPARMPTRRTWRPGFALAAGAMGVAVLAGLLFRASPETTVDTAAVADDVIFSMSYESDGAVASSSSGEDPIFIDEFGG